MFVKLFAGSFEILSNQFSNQAKRLNKKLFMITELLCEGSETALHCFKTFSTRSVLMHSPPAIKLVGW